MRLIGSNHKPAPGESLLWLIARSSAVNYFRRSDVIEVYSDKKELAFSTKSKSNPGTTEGFNLNAIKSLLGMPEENLCYSLMKFYIPRWEEGVVEDAHINQYIRLCPKCAEQGTHLLIHQVKLWDKCPVHNRKLIDCCPVCGKALGNFSVEFESGRGIFNPFKCQHCDTNLVSPDKSSAHQTGKSKKLVNEYADWMAKINKAYTKVYLLDTAMRPSVSSIQSSMLIFSSPSWVERCLQKDRNQQETEYYFYKSKSASVTQDIECCDVELTDALIGQYAKHVLLIAEKCQSDIKETFEITSETIKKTNVRKTRLPQVSKAADYSIWCEALIYLQNYIERFEKDFDRYIFLKQKGQKEWMFYCYGNPGLFEKLMSGPIKTFTKCDRLISNQKAAFEILQLWISACLYSLYCNYIGKIITQDLSFFWLYGDKKNDLDAYMLSVEDENTYFYYYYRDTIRFHVSSRKRIQLDELKSIFNSGFKTTSGFKHSDNTRRQIQRIVPHTDLKYEEKSLIAKAISLRKKAY